MDRLGAYHRYGIKRPQWRYFLAVDHVSIGTPGVSNALVAQIVGVSVQMAGRQLWELNKLGLIRDLNAEDPKLRKAWVIENKEAFKLVQRLAKNTSY